MGSEGRQGHGRGIIVVDIGVICREDCLGRKGERVQGQAVQEQLVEQPRDLEQVQADEIRIKTQGGMVWMALAMMVRTRLWPADEVSAHRDLP